MKISPLQRPVPSSVFSVGKELLNHYLDSVYEVFESPEVCPGKPRKILSFQIGEFVPLFSPQVLPFGTFCGAFVLTACNPGSFPLTKAENERRQQTLADQLQERGWIALPALGRNSEGSWVEPSFLVVGAEEGAIRELMVDWGQNAWIWIDDAGQVHLKHHGQSRVDPSFIPET